MKKNYTLLSLLNNKKTIFYFTLLLAILFSYLAVSNVKSINIKSWKEYHILLVEKSMDSDDSIFIKLQKSNFFDEIISEYNSEVAYSNYNSLSYITVDKIEKRFKHQDPRYDNYLSKISGYFKAHLDNKPYSVYYLKTEADYDQVYAIINSILGYEYNWIIPKYENYQTNTILLIIYISILLLFIYNNKKDWFLYLIHALPWAFIIYQNGKSYFFTALFMLFTLMLFLLIEKEAVKEYINTKSITFKKYLDKKIILITAITIFSFIFPVLISRGGPDYFITPISIFLFEIFFISSKFIFSYNKVKGYSHKIFYAVGIKKERIMTPLSIKSLALIYLLSLITIPFYFINSENKNIKYPVPVVMHKYPEQGLTLEYLVSISTGNEVNNYLPDYSEYIKHLAYQIRLPYKTDYSIPFDKEEITISNYYLEKNSYKIEKVTVNQFTDIWLRDNITNNKGKGIIGLMLSNTGLIQAEAGNVVPDIPLFLIPVVFGFLYPVLVYFLYDTENGIKKVQFYRTGKKIIPVIKRRKQQAA